MKCNCSIATPMPNSIKKDPFEPNLSTIRKLLTTLSTHLNRFTLYKHPFFR